MAKRIMYYKVWLHVEKITVNTAGTDILCRNLDDEFMPVTVGEFPNKELLEKEWKKYERSNDIIELLTEVLKVSALDSNLAKKISDFIVGVGKPPKGKRHSGHQ